MSSGAQRPLPPKKEVFLALLEGPSVYVHLDPRRAEVMVPPWFKKEPRLVLQVGVNMAVPIPDLKVDDEGISCTLSFSRTPFACKLPWSAVFALVGEDQRGMVWPSDVPPEVAAQMAKQAAPPPAPAPAASAEPAVKAETPVETPAEKTKKKRASRKKKEAEAKEKDGAIAAKEPKKTPTSRTSGERAEPKSLPLPLPMPEPVAAREEIAPPPAASSVGHGKKPKRELPSYLRVIK